MSISGASVQEGTVAVPTFTGGTTETLESLSQNLLERNVFIAGPDYLDRQKITFKTKDPKVNESSPSGYTQHRSEVIVKVPITLASGDTTYCTLGINLAADVEMTVAQKDSIRAVGAQLLFKANFDSFWENGSLD